MRTLLFQFESAVLIVFHYLVEYSLCPIWIISDAVPIPEVVSVYGTSIVCTYTITPTLLFVIIS